MPKVSVIIPVYNAQKYLRQCLDSIVNQTLKDIEIICINDGSTDGSLGILGEFAKNDNRVIIINQENMGAGAARNRGLDIAKGEYLSILDSDDWFEVDMLYKMYERAKQTDSDMVLCAADIYHNESKLFEKADHYLRFNLLSGLDTFSYTDIPNDIFMITHANAWLKLYDRKFVIGSNIKFQNSAICNDVYFSYVLLILANRISYLKQPFVHYRTETNSSISSKINNYHECVFTVYEDMKDYLTKKMSFAAIEHSFYKRMLDSLCDAFALIDGKKDKNQFVSECKKVLPKKYFKKFLKRNKRGGLVERVLSIRNEGVYKVIMVLGIKIRVKLKHLVLREQKRFSTIPFNQQSH
ncbi:MAG: glycosyltransferase [Elusimicrobiota bacterium]|jgi:glycosyltransferase involved in cell wall biosynthesis|nr:glycosyltransferase [Elusimicrobiota bacterium]